MVNGIKYIVFLAFVIAGLVYWFVKKKGIDSSVEHC